MCTQILTTLQIQIIAVLCAGPFLFQLRERETEEVGEEGQEEDGSYMHVFEKWS